MFFIGIEILQFKKKKYYSKVKTLVHNTHERNFY